MNQMKLFIFSLMLIFSAPIKADIVVLIHGYLGSPDSWESSGINKRLHLAGWKKAGIVFDSPNGIMKTNVFEEPDDHHVYSVSLPSKAPALYQAGLLRKMISALIQRHPGEKMTLIGHSAGGVVARLMIVKFGSGPINRLITIASPHLGTGLAVRALDETHNSLPVGIIKNIFGGEKYQIAKSSTGILIDLVPPRPGSMLYWLNSQIHPEIEYISIVRGKNINFNGDAIIPGFSQDMNNIPALKGKSVTYYTPTEHELNRIDGQAIETLLEPIF